MDPLQPPLQPPASHFAIAAQGWLELGNPKELPGVQPLMAAPQIVEYEV